LPNWAAVRSEAIVAPMNTPCSQSKASYTSGARWARRPPNTIAEIGTPWWCSVRNDAEGHCDNGAVKRLLGCAPRMGSPAVSFIPGFHGLPCQSKASSGGSPSPPSHHTAPSLVKTTFV